MYTQTQKARSLHKEILESFDVSKHGLVIFIGENNGLDVNELITLLNNSSVQFIGGYFPFLFNGATIHDDAVLVKSFNINSNIVHLSSENTDIEEFTNQYDEVNDNLFLLYDFKTEDILPVLDNLNYNSQVELKGVGAVAGRSDDNESPNLFTNAGFIDHGALGFRYREKTKSKLAHGWQRLGSNAIVTKLEGNKIVHINWTNAGEYYKSLIQEYEKREGIELSESCGDFPIGILDNSGKCIVRDVVSLDENGHLVLSEPAQLNDNIEILHGCEKGFKKAVDEILHSSLDDLENNNDVFIFSCYGRYNYNKEYFVQELENMQNICSKYKLQSTGVLSMGEIASNENNALEYHNKSVGILAK